MTRDSILELLPPDTQLSECLGACAVDTGRRLGAHYVLTGQVNIKVGENINELGAGESLHFNSNLVHKLSNPGDTQCELLVVLYTP